jgi:dienelactone hydrolase
MSRPCIAHLSKTSVRISIAGLVLGAALVGCGKREASKPPPFPARPVAETVKPGVEFYNIHIEGTGPGRPMNLNLYLPAGRHEPHSLPCVLIAPAGSGQHGSLIDRSDRPEHWPYVQAGFAVMAYELSGALADPKKKKHSYRELSGPIKRFLEAEGGLVNGQIAIDYVLEKVPEVDPAQLFACGHSSAAVIALNLAAGDSRIKACCAYAPPTDVEDWWADPQMEKYVPGFSEFATRHAPLRHVDKFNCPVFLFHADDDSLVAHADNQAFADAMQNAGKQITFVRVPSGDHYESMIDEGIPGGIEFMQKHGAQPLKPREQNGDEAKGG